MLRRALLAGRTLLLLPAFLALWPWRSGLLPLSAALLALWGVLLLLPLRLLRTGLVLLALRLLSLCAFFALRIAVALLLGFCRCGQCSGSCFSFAFGARTLLALLLPGRTLALLLFVLALLLAFFIGFFQAAQADLAYYIHKLGLGFFGFA